MSRKVVLIGYSGHSYVVYDILGRMGKIVQGYFDRKMAVKNPFALEYMGEENPDNIIAKLTELDYFISIGDNKVRRSIFESLSGRLPLPVNAIDPSAIISNKIIMGAGVMVGSGAILNSMTEIGDGVICNTGTIIEHECKIGGFTHLAPGCILAGNVEIGENSFIGAGAIVKQGVRIGSNVIVGAGTVVIKDVSDGAKMAGNPQRNI
jgi:sugar O-acyltransferase (sialic acid O-acetyltransferase NeuD family)